VGEDGGVGKDGGAGVEGGILAPVLTEANVGTMNVGD